MALTTSITYTFKNGTTVEFIVEKNKENYLNKANWSCPVDKKHIKPIIDEYLDVCIPHVYQQISNFLGVSIVWVDKNMKRMPKEFHPINQN